MIFFKKITIYSSGTILLGTIKIRLLCRAICRAKFQCSLFCGCKRQYITVCLKSMDKNYWLFTVWNELPSGFSKPVLSFCNNFNVISIVITFRFKTTDFTVWNKLPSGFFILQKFQCHLQKPTISKIRIIIIAIKQVNCNNHCSFQHLSFCLHPLPIKHVKASVVLLPLYDRDYHHLTSKSQWCPYYYQSIELFCSQVLLEVTIA